MRIVLPVLLLLAAACDTRTTAVSGSIAVIDGNHRRIVLEGAATRVISLVPAATEIMLMLQAGGVLVGRSAEDSVLQVGNVASVGRVLDPSVESIVALEPDLVIAWADHDAVLRHLATAGIPTYAARFDRLADVIPNTERIGNLLGVRDQATAMTKTLTSELSALQARYSARARTTVLYLLDAEQLWTAGPKTFVDDLIQIAGGRNVFDDLPAAWGMVSLEAVIARQPDVIVVAQPRPHIDLATLLRKPGWRDLRALRTNRIYVVDSDQFNRAGPNVVTTARILAQLLHPETGL